MYAPAVAKAAKKRKKDDEDEEFAFPEFDEGKYLRHEIDMAKATFVTIILAVPLAVLLYALTLAGVTIVAFFAGLTITFALPRIFGVLPWPKIDLAGFERKDWFGQGGTFLFSWLAFWILLINVPFADLTPPSIEAVTVNGVAVRNGEGHNFSAGDFYINATVFENGVLDRLEFRVGSTMVNATGTGPQYRLPSVHLTSTTNVSILARDTAGHQATYSFTIAIQ